MINTGKTDNGTKITINSAYYIVVWPDNVLTGKIQVRTTEGKLVEEKQHSTAYDLSKLIGKYSEKFIKTEEFYEISVIEGLTNSQMYTRDFSNASTISDINFNNRFINCLNVENINFSRKDFANLLRDIFTHYRNIRASKEKSDFFNIGKFFRLKYK